MESRVSVSVEIVRVEEEPQWDQNEAQPPEVLKEYEKPVCVKEEPSCFEDTSCGEIAFGQQVSSGKNGADHRVTPAGEGADHKVTPTSHGADHNVTLTSEGADHKLTSTSEGADHKVTPTSEGTFHKVASTSEDAGHQVTRLVLNPLLMLQSELVYLLNGSNQALLKPPVPRKARTRKRKLEKSYTCDICNQNFKCVSHMAKHKLIHQVKLPAGKLKKRPFFCVICNKPFSQLIKFTAHLQSHTTKLPYCCDICKKEFSGLSEFVKHSESHGGTYVCELCDERFVCKIELLRHRLNHTVRENNCNRPKRINILRRKIVSKGI